MTIDADLDLFFSFGASSVTAGAVSGLGLLMMPGEIIADGMVMSTDYELTVKTSEFGNLGYGAGIVVDAEPYTVRNVKPIDDGRLSIVQMQATVAPQVIHPGPQGPIGGHLPVGGNPGDVLLKDSYADYEADWATTLDGGTFY